MEEPWNVTNLIDPLSAHVWSLVLAFVVINSFRHLQNEHSPTCRKLFKQVLEISACTSKREPVKYVPNHPPSASFRFILHSVWNEIDYILLTRTLIKDQFYWWCYTRSSDELFRGLFVEVFISMRLLFSDYMSAFNISFMLLAVMKMFIVYAQSHERHEKYLQYSNHQYLKSQLKHIKFMLEAFIFFDRWIIWKFVIKLEWNSFLPSFPFCQISVPPTFRYLQVSKSLKLV